MGDDAAAPGLDTAVQATHEPVPTSETSNGKADAARATRAEKLAAARTARLSGASSTHTPEPEASKGGAAATENTLAATGHAASPAEPKTPEVDDATKRGLDAIEKRDKRAREQLAADRAALKAEQEEWRAQQAQAKAAAGKKTSLEELQKLPVRDRYREAIRMAGIDPDDEEHMELVARDSYARSKSGKNDPKNKQYADQIAEVGHRDQTVAELKRELDELKNGLTEREKATQAKQFADRYLDEAVKAIPATPSLVSRTMEKNRDRARAEMLSIGQRLERENGELPSHSEVVAEYEKALRADLADRGLDDAAINAMLTPPKAAATTTTAPRTLSRTLDPSTGPSTQTIHGQQSRADKLKAASAELKRRRAADG